MRGGGPPQGPRRRRPAGRRDRRLDPRHGPVANAGPRLFAGARPSVLRRRGSVARRDGPPPSRLPAVLLRARALPALRDDGAPARGAPRLLHSGPSRGLPAVDGLFRAVSGGVAGLFTRRMAGARDGGLPLDLGLPRLRLLFGVELEAHPVRAPDLARALGAPRARHRAGPSTGRGIPLGPAPLGGVLRAPLRSGSGLRVGRGISRALRERAHGPPRALSPARRVRPQRLASTFRRAARRRSRARRGRAVAHFRGGASHRASRRGARDHAVADRRARPRGSGTGRSPPAEGALPRGASVLPPAPHAGGVARVERAGLWPLTPRNRGALSVR